MKYLTLKGYGLILYYADDDNGGIYVEYEPKREGPRGKQLIRRTFKKFILYHCKPEYISIQFRYLPIDLARKLIDPLSLDKEGIFTDTEYEILYEKLLPNRKRNLEKLLEALRKTKRR